MKLKFLMVSAGLLLLTACGNDEPEDQTEETAEETTEETTETPENQEGNLIDFDTLDEGYWVDYDGTEASNSQMLTTQMISYNPENEYTITRGAYVSYYNDEEFISTVNTPDDSVIDTVDEANNIKLSFNEAFLDQMELTEE